MSEKVVSIRGADVTTAADCVSLADDLELLAARIRRGEISAYRGVLIYETHEHFIRPMALGDPVSRLEAIGMAAWAIDALKSS